MESVSIQYRYLNQYHIVFRCKRKMDNRPGLVWSHLTSLCCQQFCLSRLGSVFLGLHGQVEWMSSLVRLFHGGQNGVKLQVTEGQEIVTECVCVCVCVRGGGGKETRGVRRERIRCQKRESVFQECDNLARLYLRSVGQGDCYCGWVQIIHRQTVKRADMEETDRTGHDTYPEPCIEREM